MNSTLSSSDFNKYYEQKGVINASAKLIEIGSHLCEIANGGMSNQYFIFFMMSSIVNSSLVKYYRLRAS